MTVRVTVPASSANLGPGFDCMGIGLALNLKLTVTEVDGVGVEIRHRGEGENIIPKDSSNTVVAAMFSVMNRLGYHPKRLVIEVVNEIPIARGLGSSAAANIAGLAAATALTGGTIDRCELLQHSYLREGHADNACASLFGGFCVTGMRLNGIPDFVQFPVPNGIEAAVVVPDFTLKTEDSRAVLPNTISFKEATQNQARVALLTAAIASGKLELLDISMRDVFHEPYRNSLVPGLKEVCSAAVEAGAFGAVLSGAGPSIFAVVRVGDKKPGLAMKDTWQSLGVGARFMQLAFDNIGLRVDK